MAQSNNPAFGNWICPGDDGSKGGRSCRGHAGERIVKYYECNACSVYRTLLYNCDWLDLTARFCTGMVERTFALTAASSMGHRPAHPSGQRYDGRGEQYSAVMVDPNPAGHPIPEELQLAARWVRE